MIRPSIALLASLITALACQRHTESDPSSAGAHGHDALIPAPAAPAADEHAGHGAAHGGAAGVDGATTAPAGYAAFTLPADRARSIGLRVAKVEERDFSKRLRTTGAVVLDETRTSHVHSKVRGWVEDVYVDFIGKNVSAGAPLCSIYSQEVLAAQLEFLSILEQTTGTGLPAGPLADAERRSRDQLLAAARRRLALWDVPSGEIARLEATREPRRTFTLHAPRSGVVVAKQAIAGMFIDPAVELYVVSDTRKLWLLADVYESDVPGVKVGDPASLELEGLTRSKLSARVAFLPPTVDETSRTVKVRFDLDNPSGAVRPGAFATVELEVALGRALGIPESAVIHAGPEAVVFVVHGEHIEPRSVTLGALVDGHYAVRSGLRADEAVAVGAQFLIDSESRLRATSGRGPGHAGH